MRGLALFAAKLRARPAAAVGGLLLDYLAWIAIVIFALSLILTRWPLAVVDRLFGLEIRERLVNLVDRLASGR